MGRLTGGAALLLLLAGCALPPGTEERIEFDPLLLEYRRQVERDFTERPFARGSIAVVTQEGREIETYRLVPCRGGAAICAWSEDGPAGTLTVTPDWHVVRGLLGRTFWLSYAGDGYVERGGVLTPLTWSARADGDTDGTQAALESAAPHR